MAVTQERLWRGATKAERSAQRRARLVDAGVEVFGTVGFRDATVRSICRHAGLTERYFYESFANLPAALAAVYSDVADRGYTRMAAATSTPHPLRTGLSVFFGDLRADPRAARVQLTEVLGVDADIDRLFQQHLQRAADLLLTLARPTVRPPASVELVAKGLVGASVEIATEWLLDGFRLPTATVVASTLSILGAVLDPAGQPGP